VDGVVVATDTEARKIVGAEMFGDGLETIIAASSAGGAIAESAKRKIEIIADYKDIVRGDFVKIGESADGEAGFVVKSLGFNEDVLVVFDVFGVKFGVF